jgi:hypothetical protein
LFKIKSLDILFIFFIFIVLSLGTWQVFRLNSKSQLISDLENNLKRNSIDFNVDIDKEYTKVLLKVIYQLFELVITLKLVLKLLRVIKNVFNFMKEQLLLKKIVQLTQQLPYEKFYKVLG